MKHESNSQANTISRDSMFRARQQQSQQSRFVRVLKLKQPIPTSIKFDPHHHLKAKTTLNRHTHNERRRKETEWVSFGPFKLRKATSTKNDFKTLLKL